MDKKVNVVIIEDHNEALAHIYRAIGSKKIPFSGLKMLHFDSHPDLGLPDIACNIIKSKPQSLLSTLSIENWIMPAVFAGHINHLIWMHPSWSGQLLDRKKTDYFIGEEKSTKRLSVNIGESYFVHDGVFAPASDMQVPAPFSLSVAPVHEAHTACKTCSDIVFSLLNEIFLLDIDLDTFSTQDPFKERFTPQQKKLIDELYSTKAIGKGPWASEKEAEIASKARRDQLSQLLTWIQMLEANQPLPIKENDNARKLMELVNLVKSQQNTSSSKPLKVRRSRSEPRPILQEDTDDEEDEEDIRVAPVGANTGDGPLEGHEEEETLEFLHYLWSGIDADTDSLPHHVSTEAEIDGLISMMESLLNRLHNPVLITISRSSSDGYTPAHQVDMIQSKVEKCLIRVYGERILNFDRIYDKSGKKQEPTSGRPSSPPVMQHATKEPRQIRGKKGIV